MKPFAGHLGRAALAAVLLPALLLGQGERALRASLPAVQGVVERVAPELGVLALEPEVERADRVLRLSVTLAHHVVLGTRVLAPDPRGRANASVPLLQGLQGPLLALWLVLAAPLAMGWRRRALALLLVLPAAAALAVLDPALVLAGRVWQLLVDAAAPGSFSPLVAAAEALQGGARLALAAVAAALALAGARALPRASRFSRDRASARASC